MKRAPRLGSTCSQELLKCTAQFFHDLQLLAFLKGRSIPVDCVNLSTTQWKEFKANRLLPPGFQLESQGRLKLVEYVWLSTAQMLQEAGFSNNQISSFRSTLFARYEPFVEEESGRGETALTFVFLEQLLLTCLTSTKDCQLHFCSNGQIELGLKQTPEALTSNGVKWQSFSLFELLGHLLNVKLPKAEELYGAEVSLAEWTLLEAVRNTDFNKVVLQRRAHEQSYKWLLTTEQHGVADRKELADLMFQAAKNYGQFTITGVGTSKKVPYRLTRDHRL